MMEMVMGKMPDRFARAGARSKPEFFKEGSKLDWPKPKASRQSKKDVRATRLLSVSLSFFIAPLCYSSAPIGCHTTYWLDQPTFPEPRSEALGFWPHSANYCRRGSQASILLLEYPRWDITLLSSCFALLPSVALGFIWTPCSLLWSVYYITIGISIVMNRYPFPNYEGQFISPICGFTWTCIIVWRTVPTTLSVREQEIPDKGPAVLSRAAPAASRFFFQFMAGNWCVLRHHWM